MTCPRCQAENDAGANFCEDCGARLEAACPSCGTPVTPGKKFCRSCGAALTPEPSRFASPDSYTPRHLAEKILTSKAALEGERKQVTVLFADISGFTSLSARVDPEDVHGLMKRSFELMLDEVHRYEGTVNQFLGDGLMALFGAPLAHEDHARRAVRAALGIRRTLARYQHDLEPRGLAFQVRQGLNTGLVVVGSIGNDLRMDYTAVGDTTNVAARMQQAAEPGRILISEATHRQVAGYFDTQPLGPLRLKGKPEPIPAWEVIADRQSRTRLDVEAERGLTPFVGRGEELLLLRDRFDRAAAGRGQVVFLVGEPGIGKSRLLHEFRAGVAGQSTWIEGQCVSHGRTVALHPIIGLLKTAFDIRDGDSEAAVIDKIDRSVRRLGEDRSAVRPFLKDLLSVDTGDPALATMDPRLRRGEIFDALRRLLLRAAHVRPQIVVVEGLHWVDRASEDALLSVINGITAARVLLVLTYRPGYQQPFGERTTYTRIALAGLGEADMRAMADGLLAAREAPAGLESLVTRRADGNPFFVEEITRSLLEATPPPRRDDGGGLTPLSADADVPRTIHDIITARIDRLQEPSKRALQVASVIGREFTRRLLAHTAEVDQLDDLLRDLQSLELIYESAALPEATYMFKHALTQEVAYASLLLQRRKEIHRAIGLALETLHANRLVEHYETLAHHFMRAEDWTRALDYLSKAADKATRTFANREALALLDQALEACGRLGKATERGAVAKIHQLRIGLYFAVADFDSTSQAAEALRTEARRIGSEAIETAALSALAWARFWAHDFALAITRAREAIGLGERTGQAQAVIPARLTLVCERGIKGDLDVAERELDATAAVARDVGDLAAQGFESYLKALFRNWRGEYGDGIRIATAGIAFVRQHGLAAPLILNLWTLSLNLVGAGEYARARTTLDELLSITERTGEDLHWLKALNALGWLHFECGDVPAAIDLNQRCADHVRTLKDPEILGNARLNLADGFLARGDLSQASDVLGAVHRMVEDPAVSEWMKWRYTTHLFASLGDLALARDDFAAVHRWTGQCLEVATPRLSRKYISKAYRLRGEALLARRRWDEAEEQLHRALEVAQQIGNPTQLWRTHVGVARLAEARADAGRAGEAWAAAHRVITAMATAISDPGLAACLWTLPLVREVQDRMAHHA